MSFNFPHENLYAICGTPEIETKKGQSLPILCRVQYNDALIQSSPVGGMCQIMTYIATNNIENTLF